MRGASSAGSLAEANDLEGVQFPIDPMSLSAREADVPYAGFFYWFGKVAFEMRLS
jgi:hypothetical protein